MIFAASLWTNVQAASLPSAKRVVFLGDSITYSGEYIAYLEAYLLVRFPERQFELVDVGLPSETVSGLSEPGHAGGKFPRPDLHERLDRVLQKLKPELVIACYGMNDGIYYPFGEERFSAFSNGIVRLRAKVLATGAQIVHLTPPAFDPTPLKGKALPAGLEEYRQPYERYDDVLARYSEWLLSRRANGWNVIDIHGPMKRHIETRRRNSPGFILAGDGIHANATGHLLMTAQILKAWGLPVERTFPDIDWKAKKAANGDVSNLRIASDTLTFTWRRHRGLPKDPKWDLDSLKLEGLDRWNLREEFRLKNGPASRYGVFLGNDFSAQELEAGFEVFSVSGEALERSDLLSLIRKRQRLLSDAWLTDIGHLRPGMTPGMAITEATQQAKAIQQQIQSLASPEVLHVLIRPGE